MTRATLADIRVDLTKVDEHEAARCMGISLRALRLTEGSPMDATLREFLEWASRSVSRSGSRRSRLLASSGKRCLP
jgi:hypothetical protein